MLRVGLPPPEQHEAHPDALNQAHHKVGADLHSVMSERVSSDVMFWQSSVSRSTTPTTRLVRTCGISVGHTQLVR